MFNQREERTHCLLILYFSQWIAMCHLMLFCTASAAPHILRIREGTPSGTVLIPDVISFLAGEKQQSPSELHNAASKTEGQLLAIGNAVMPGASWLTINPIRGSLLVKSPPDRDALCPTEFKLPETAIAIDRGGVEFPDYIHPPSNLQRNGINPGECVVEVSIVYGSPTNPSFDILNIVIEDINDHAPTFSFNGKGDSDNSEYVIKVPESNRLISSHSTDSSIHELPVKSNIRIPLPLAKDHDEGLNGINGYRLEGQDAYLFRLEVGVPIDEMQHADGESPYTKPSLYRQKKSSQLWLVPVDAKTGRSSTSNSPVYLDREERAEYHFVLVAFDRGAPQRTGRLPIRLVVEDTNDNAPKFNQDWYSGKLSENDPPGHVIFEFSAHDIDGEGGNSRIGFRIPGESDVTNGLLDTTRKTSETSGLSDAQIAAAGYFSIEQFSPDVSSSTNQIHLSNRLNATYGRLIVRRQSKENVQKAASRALEVARKHSSNSPFKDPNQDRYTPAIEFSVPNNEEGVRLEFFIEAYDYGQPVALSTRVPVHIQITDVNDHPPKIFVSYLREAEHLGRPILNNIGGASTWGKIRENLGRAMLAQVTVTDEDALYAETDIACNTNDSRFTLEEISAIGHFGDLSGLWTRGNVPLSDQASLPKQIPSDSAVDFLTRSPRANLIPTKMFKLMLNAPLDRETSAGHQMAVVQFFITCTDNARGQLPGGQLTATAPIRILIEDANDNAPVFEQTHYTFRVPENHPVVKPNEMIATRERFLVGRVRATDSDEGWNAALEYRLVSNPSSALELDRLTGQLYVTRPFDRESISEIVFQVLAIDCAPDEETKFPRPATEARMTGTAEVRLIVEDINDCPPIFQETNYHFEVEEGIDLIKVGQVWATDADQGEFARITYRLAVGPGSRLQEHMPEDRATSRSMSNQLYDEALEINSHFQIDPTNGIIHLKGRLDRERRAHYEFVVLAVDNARTIVPKSEGIYGSKKAEAIQFTGTATVLITVLDQNDNPPRIISPRNHAHFSLGPDQLIAGNTVFTIRATDPDLGENGTIEYSLLSVEDDFGSWSSGSPYPEPDNTVTNGTKLTGTYHKRVTISNANKTAAEVPFAVDQTAGICYLRENLPPLNADGPRAYLLRIRAYDLGKPQSLNTSLVVRVARQTFSSSESILPSESVADKPGTGSLDLTHAGQNRLSDTSAYEGKIGAWASAGQARISDRTMVVILSTVFVLLLLTTIVLLLLVRYRRLFLRNISFNGTHSGDGSVGKANSGKHYNTHPNSHSPHGIFTEVLTAPWVNSSASPIESPNTFNYPNLYNTPNSVMHGDHIRGCVTNPGAFWSPTSGTGKSPAEFRRLFSNENQSAVFHTPPLQNTCSARYELEMLPRTLGPNRRYGLNDVSFTEDVPRTFVLENYSIPEDDGDYRALTMNPRAEKLASQVSYTGHHRNNRRVDLDTGMLLPNTWAKLTPVQTPPQVSRGQTMMKRAAISLEDLSGETALKEYNTIDPLEMSKSRTSVKKSRIRNEYQALSGKSRTAQCEARSVDEVVSADGLNDANEERSSDVVRSEAMAANNEFSSLFSSLLSNPRDSLIDAKPTQTVVFTNQPGVASITNSSPQQGPQKSNLKGFKPSTSNYVSSTVAGSVVTFENAPRSDTTTLRTPTLHIRHNPHCPNVNLGYMPRENNSPKKTRFADHQTSHPNSPINSSHVQGSFV